MHYATMGGFIRVLRDHFFPEWKLFLLGGACAILTASFGVAYLKILERTGDELQSALENGGTLRFEWVSFVLALFLLVAVARALALYIMTIANNSGVQNGLVRVQEQLFEHLTFADFQRVSSYNSGALVSRFIHDVNSLRDASLRIANNFTKSIATTVGVVGWLILADWQLALLVLIIYPLALIPVLRLGKLVRKRSKHAQRQIGGLTSFLSEFLRSLRVVRAYGLEDNQLVKASEAFNERSTRFIRVLKQKAAIDPILEVFGGLALAGIIVFMAFQIASGASTFGNLLGIIGAMLMLAPEIRALGSLSAVVQEAGAASDRIHEIINAEDQARPVDLGKESRGFSTLEAIDISFWYGDDTRALHNTNIKLNAGEVAVLKGESGSGKSTLVNLLLRLYQPNGGRILLDGEDCEAFDVRSYRSQIGLVPQEPTLFDDTIYNNILFGKLDADLEAVQAASRAAQTHAFIEKSNLGYQTNIGETGKSLSGGQRQRIALARALIRRPSLLLLDEPTSALDEKASARVLATVRDCASQGIIVLIISHKQEVIDAADMVWEISSGTTRRMPNVHI